MGERLDDEALHLEELDVLPGHGRQGIGTRLVRALCDGARGRGIAAVTLCTFRDVPWNAPFYERLGFRILGSHPKRSPTAVILPAGEVESDRQRGPPCLAHKKGDMQGTSPG